MYELTLTEPFAPQTIIPKQLYNRSMWANWIKGASKGNGRFDKIPCDSSGRYFPSTKADEPKWYERPEYLLRISDADKAVKEKRTAGLLISLYGIHDYTCIDLDECVEPVQDAEGKVQYNILNDTARTILNMVNGWSEVSVSGTGIHIFVEGKWTKSSKFINTADNQEIEVYCGNHAMCFTGRYIVGTGSATDNSEKALPARQTELEELGKWLDTNCEAVGGSPLTLSADALQGQFEGDTQERLKYALSKDIKLFHLWNDSVPEGIDDKTSKIKNEIEVLRSYAPHQSEYDFVLCEKLAYWFDRDFEVIKDLFMQSPFYLAKDAEHLAKWQTGSYVKNTVGKACAVVKTTASEDQQKRQAQIMEKSETVVIDSNITRSAICDFLEEYGKTQIENLAEFLSGKDLNDLFLAKTFIKTLNGYIIHNNEKTFGWMLYNGFKWLKFCDEEVKNLSHRFVERINTEAQRKAEAEYNENRKVSKETERFLADCRKLNQSAVFNRMLITAESEVFVRTEQFNLHTDIINTPDGYITLGDKEKKLTPCSPEMFLTLSTNYSPSTEGADIWQKFLDTVTDNDKELQTYLQTVMGMALYGRIFESGIYFVHGMGGTGKSTFFKIIENVLGKDYFATVNSDLLTPKRNTGRFNSAMLEGKRLAIIGELEEGAVLHEDIMKRLSSQDEIEIENKFEQPRTVPPTATIFLFTNFLPVIKSTDSGTWRRINIIPFKHKFEEKDRQTAYENYIVDKCAGAVLNWMLDGAIMFKQNGFKLNPPKKVTELKESYMQEQNSVTQFLRECTEKTAGSQEPSETTAKILKAYREYCYDMGMIPKKKSLFELELKRNGFKIEEGRARKRVWLGLKLIDDA